MIKNVSEVANFLEDAVRDFTDIAVIGVSGGIDSATVAHICVKALGKENVNLISMPYDDIDTSTFNARSTKLANKVGTPHHVVNIKAASDLLETDLGQIFEGQELLQLTKANIRPRVRMNVLYSVAGQIGYSSAKRVRVMGTGHLSEDLIGYDTKGGDALADIFILSDLVKSEVYQLAAYYGVSESICKAAPSAGLYPGQTDEEELGFSYDQLEPATLALFKLLRNGVSKQELNSDRAEFSGISPNTVKFVVERYKAHSHKHEAPTTVPLRDHSEWFEV